MVEPYVGWFRVMLLGFAVAAVANFLDSDALGGIAFLVWSPAAVLWIRTRRHALFHSWIGPTER